jgi:NDP-sugar pyrophosphorylase family protein
MVGTLTDGDIRRGLLKGIELFDKVDKVMCSSFQFLETGKFSVSDIRRLKGEYIYIVPVLNDKHEIIKVYDFNRIKSVLPIDAVIMAGGRGERLRPLTDSIPKPLLRLGNKSIIEYNIDRLIEFGVENIYITVNYLADKVINFFNSNKKEANLVFIKETMPMGTIGSLGLIKDFKNDQVLIMNSDLFTNVNCEDFFSHFEQENSAMSVASIPYNVDLPYAVMDVINENVSSLKEKPTYNYYTNAGIYVIKKDILKFIPSDQPMNATDLIDKVIENKMKVTHFPIIGYWIDIGKPYI